MKTDNIYVVMVCPGAPLSANRTSPYRPAVKVNGATSPQSFPRNYLDIIIGNLPPEVKGLSLRSRTAFVCAVLAVIQQESHFNARALSVRGAVGLMQLLPSVASELHGRPVSREELYNPSLNIKLGMKYLAKLLLIVSKRPGRMMLYTYVAFSAYFHGPNNLRRWLTEAVRRPISEVLKEKQRSWYAEQVRNKYRDYWRKYFSEIVEKLKLPKNSLRTARNDSLPPQFGR